MGQAIGLCRLAAQPSPEVRTMFRGFWTHIHGAGLTVLLLGFLLIMGGASTPKVPPYTTWSAFGGMSDSMQYLALTQINKTNVKQSRDPIIQLF